MRTNNKQVVKVNLEDTASWLNEKVLVTRTIRGYPSPLQFEAKYKGVDLDTGEILLQLNGDIETIYLDGPNLSIMKDGDYKREIINKNQFVKELNLENLADLMYKPVEVIPKKGESKKGILNKFDKENNSLVLYNTNSNTKEKYLLDEFRAIQHKTQRYTL